MREKVMQKVAPSRRSGKVTTYASLDSGLDGHLPIIRHLPNTESTIVCRERSIYNRIACDVYDGPAGQGSQVPQRACSPREQGRKHPLGEHAHARAPHARFLKPLLPAAHFHSKFCCFRISVLEFQRFCRPFCLPSLGSDDIPS